MLSREHEGPNFEVAGSDCRQRSGQLHLRKLGNERIVQFGHARHSIHESACHGLSIRLGPVDPDGIGAVGASRISGHDPGVLLIGACSDRRKSALLGSQSGVVFIGNSCLRWLIRFAQPDGQRPDDVHHHPRVAHVHVGVTTVRLTLVAFGGDPVDGLDDRLR
jgi:hypothetical protein